MSRDKGNRRAPLQRHTEIRSGAPLQRGGELNRTGRIKPVSDKRAARREAEREVWRVVKARDKRCQLADHQGDPIVGRCWGPLTPHHKRKASQGGAYDEANIAALCSFHNDEIEANADLAAFARQLGLVIRREDQSQGGTP